MDKSVHGRIDRLIQEKRHDAYQSTGKWPEPARCIECNALFVNGRWSWQELPPSREVHETICPACRRIADRFPAGYVNLKGLFFKAHQDEILNLIMNVEKQEKNERPLERIMEITHNPEYTCITTTGIHLARRIGQALSRAYKGDFSCRYADAEQSVRVYWERS